MVIFRCTRELLARLGRAPAASSAASTTRLGDWYVALARVGQRQYLLAISERGRLPVVVPARDARAMATPVADAVRRALLAIGVPEADVDAECAAMADATFAPTSSRSLLGTINDFTFALRHRLQGEPDTPLDDLALWLAETPILTPFDGESPRNVTRQLFDLEKTLRTRWPLPDASPMPDEGATAERPRRPRRKHDDPLPIDFALFARTSFVQRCEYFDGAMHGSPAPTPAHQHAALRVARALEDYFAARDRDAVVLAGPVKTFLDEQTVAQPDVVVVRRRQLSDRGIEGAPQIVVEVVTAESAERDREVKVRIYGAAGVERYWLVDVDQQAVECLGRRRLPGPAAMSRSTNVLTLEDLPGFELRLDTLWL